MLILKVKIQVHVLVFINY